MPSIDLHSAITAPHNAADSRPAIPPVGANLPEGPPGSPFGIGTAMPSAADDDAAGWRELTLTAADFAYQADAWGRLVWVAPTAALGWDPAGLIGGPGATLLAVGGGGDADPFRPDRLWRQRPVWLRHADGGMRCVAISAAPILDAAGQIAGVRGLGFEIAGASPDARLLRRAATMEAMWRRIGRETAADRMVKIALDALAGAVGATGAVLYAPAEHRIICRNGEESGLAIPQAAASLLAVAEVGTVHAGSHHDTEMLACRIRCRAGGDVIVVLWRHRPARWDEGDHDVLGSAAGILRLVTEQESIQRALAEQGRTDPVTGLATAETFVTDAMRCIERLDRDREPGTLICAEIDDFAMLSSDLGQAAADELLLTLAMLLQATVRPTDLVGRLAGGIFVLWLNGADQLTAAERADALRRGAPRVLAEVADVQGTTLTLSQGIACREPGTGESIEALLRRAHEARLAAHAGGGGQWRVSQLP